MVRKDLSVPQQAVQAIHAAIECVRTIAPDIEHPHIVLCSVRDETKLKTELERLIVLGFKCFPFVEPDLNGELTAFSVGPVTEEAERRHFRRYQILEV